MTDVKFRPDIWCFVGLGDDRGWPFAVPMEGARAGAVLLLCLTNPLVEVGEVAPGSLLPLLPLPDPIVMVLLR